MTERATEHPSEDWLAEIDQPMAVAARQYIADLRRQLDDTCAQLEFARSRETSDPLAILRNVYGCSVQTDRHADRVTGDDVFRTIVQFGEVRFADDIRVRMANLTHDALLQSRRRLLQAVQDHVSKAVGRFIERQKVDFRARADFGLMVPPPPNSILKTDGI